VFDPGTKVRLLTRIGAFPVGTVGTVVDARRDGTCIVEFESSSRLEMDCAVLAPVS
jgi:hypothetical protein